MKNTYENNEVKEVETPGLIKIYKKLRRAIHVILYTIANRIIEFLFPLNQNRVLFLSEMRAELGGNFKLIYNAITNPTLEKVLSLKASRQTKRTLKQKIMAVYYVATSKYILLEDYTALVRYMHKRKDQQIIQLGHGSGALKKIGAGRNDVSARSQNINKEIKKVNGHKNYTKAMVGTEPEKHIYADAYEMPLEDIIPAGFARTDVFFDKAYLEKVSRSLHNEFPWMEGKKVILFAPTFRGGGSNSAYYDLEMLDLDGIYTALHKDYVFIIKWHPTVFNRREENGVSGLDLQKYNGFYRDLSSASDINDLLVVTDILITDYSSVMFDYVFLDRPMINYVYDLDKYVEERGLYCDYDEYVFSQKATTPDELIDALKNAKVDEEKRQKFISKFMSACDGHSTEKICKAIFGDVPFK